MKKVIVSIVLSIFLASLVAAASCSVSTGYDYCQYEKHTYGSAEARALVQISIVKPEVRLAGLWTDSKNVNHNYFVGGAKLSYTTSYCDEVKSFIGTDVDDIECGDNGCSGGRGISETGVIELIDGGEEFSGPISIACWNMKTASNGDWSWVWAGFGFYDWEYRAVDCYDNTDCGTGKICDKSGTWDEWYCKNKECNNGETKCDGFNSYTCESDKWVNKGVVQNKCNVTCVPKTEQCRGEGLRDLFVCSSDYKYINNSNVIGKCGVECFEGTNQCYGLDYRICSSNLVWENKGRIKDECEVSCVSASDCKEGEFSGSQFCTGNSISQKFIKYTCNENNLCELSSDVITKKINSCEGICVNGLCTSPIVITEEPNTVVKYGLTILIILAAGIFLIAFGRKK